MTFSEAQENVIDTILRFGNVAGAQKIILGELAKELGDQLQRGRDVCRAAGYPEKQSKQCRRKRGHGSICLR